MGREPELDRIRGFLDGGDRCVALFLEGVAGIGKTTLWAAGIELARERGYRVLACRPTAAETAFSFAALRDLLSGVEAVTELPGPQRHALEVALALREDEGVALSEGLLGAALVSSLESLAQADRVLVAIDDLQWLDVASRSVLQFAVRRLTRGPIKLLAATRERALLEVQRELSEEIVRVEPGPLSVRALHRIVVSRLGESLARPTLHKIHQISGGNPFYAIEVARSIVERPTRVRVGDPVPVPATIDSLIRARLDQLEPPVTELLELAALLAEPTSEALASATRQKLHSIEALLDRAVATDVIEITDGRIRFTHPLLGAAVGSAIPPHRRKQLHARLAAIATEPEERARHLAAASELPSTHVADSLEQAGKLAALRGAPSAAAELLELAADRTPAEESAPRWRRLNDAGLRYAAAGDVRRARELLEPLADEVPPGPLRAEVLLNLADFRWDDPEAAIDLAERSLREIGGDQACQARAHMLLSSHYLEGGRGPALDHMRAAHDAALRSGDDQLALLALANRTLVEVCAGEITDDAFVDALGRVRRASGGEMRIAQFESPHLVLGLAFLALGRFGEAKAEFELAVIDAAEQGVAFASACAHAGIAEVGARLGDWEVAQRSAAECAEHYEQLGMREQPDALYVSALTSAQVGNIDDARSAAERGAAIASSGGRDLWAAANRSVLGFLELSLGNPAAAVESLDPPDQRAAIERWHFPIYHDLFVNAVEGLVEVGDVDAAANLLGALEERAKRLDNAWERATRARCRGLVRAGEGDVDQALAAFEDALGDHERVEVPLDHARTLFALGRFYRRINRKRDARASLEAAFERFEELGAVRWAEQARSELDRIGGRAPTRDGLTPTERRVAELVAQGLPNKEIASTLVVTVKAVEANLTRVYAKLGIRSRTQLTRLLNKRS